VLVIEGVAVELSVAQLRELRRLAESTQVYFPKMIQAVCS
jgi:hypothetical protein